jgi:hypothetical protein
MVRQRQADIAPRLVELPVNPRPASTAPGRHRKRTRAAVTPDATSRTSQPCRPRPGPIRAGGVGMMPLFAEPARRTARLPVCARRYLTAVNRTATPAAWGIAASAACACAAVGRRAGGRASMECRSVPTDPNRRLRRARPAHSRPRFPLDGGHGATELFNPSECSLAYLRPMAGQPRRSLSVGVDECGFWWPTTTELPGCC